MILIYLQSLQIHKVKKRKERKARRKKETLNNAVILLGGSF